MFPFCSVLFSVAVFKWFLLADNDLISMYARPQKKQKRCSTQTWPLVGGVISAMNFCIKISLLHGNWMQHCIFPTDRESGRFQICTLETVFVLFHFQEMQTEYSCRQTAKTKVLSFPGKCHVNGALNTPLCILFTTETEPWSSLWANWHFNMFWDMKMYTCDLCNTIHNFSLNGPKMKSTSTKTILNSSHWF